MMAMHTLQPDLAFALRLAILVSVMQHRHIDSQTLTLAALDDIIRRGDWRDWVTLRRAAQRDPKVVDGIRRVCTSVASDPRQEGAQRLGFWKMYAQRLTATVG